MDIRNIQKTGDMHYVYLPTSWCREHKVGAKSKVSLDQNSDGSINISPELTEKKPKHLKFHVTEDEPEAIHKLVVASYINPAASFEINMDKEMDFTKLINQKRLISFESVEIDKKQITSEGSVTVADPGSLLKTMAKKIKNMIIVMQENYDKVLIQKYEDEIDRSKMLIEKSVIGSLTFGKTTKLKNIELYYIAHISKELERLVDRLIMLEKGNSKFLDDITKPIELLQNILHDTANLDQKQTMEFAKSVIVIKKSDIKDVKDVRNYDMEIMRQNLTTISEVVMDWMVTLKLEN
jgi:phosphate uptake regulator